MKTDELMENIAVYDALEREGFSEAIIDRIEHTLNSYELLLQASKVLVTEFQYYKKRQFKLLVNDQTFESASKNWEKATVLGEGAFDFRPLIDAVSQAEGLK